MTPFKPLVVGPPRSGFALLASVVIHFVPYAPPKATLSQRLLNAFVDELGPTVSGAIVAAFARRGITDDLIYNGNFRSLTGGPKFLRPGRPEYACFRKYIGVRGLGDFSLITCHPHQVLDCDEVVHSHVDAAIWPVHPAYADYVRYASMRNLAGIINSSAFSLNALASEYIQRFVPPERDNDLIRKRLAVYKLTDLAFIEGLIGYLASYIETFLVHQHRYHVMKWEDLLLRPIETIVRLGAAGGFDVSAGEAQRIWSLLDHRNLTGDHRHNYRAGHGVVGGWRTTLVNEHLELMKARGFDAFMVELGYEPLAYINEARYTPFQKRIRRFLRAGRVYRNFPDQDLFGFAFNKTNIVSDRFPFRRYDWREWTQIERSSFSDEALQNEIWSVAEDATTRLNRVFDQVLRIATSSEAAASSGLSALERTCSDALPPDAGARWTSALAAARRVIHGWFAAAPTPAAHPGPPQLVGEHKGRNIVRFSGICYGIPQELGDVRLERDEHHPGILRGASPADVIAQIDAAAPVEGKAS